MYTILRQVVQENLSETVKLKISAGSGWWLYLNDSKWFYKYIYIYIRYASAGVWFAFLSDGGKLIPSHQDHQEQNLSKSWLLHKVYSKIRFLWWKPACPGLKGLCTGCAWSRWESTGLQAAVGHPGGCYNHGAKTIINQWFNDHVSDGFYQHRSRSSFKGRGIRTESTIISRCATLERTSDEPWVWHHFQPKVKGTGQNPCALVFWRAVTFWKVER